MTFKTLLLRLRDVPGRVRTRCRPFAKPLAVLTGLYALGISAILRANYNYIDDLQRVYTGYQGWENFSRYLSNLLSNFIHADSYLTDVSPLPQLLACLILAAASVAVLYLVTGRKRFSVWEYAAVLPLGLSPYMLECLSFKFDAPYMAVSVLASVSPLLAAKKYPPQGLAAGSVLLSRHTGHVPDLSGRLRHPAHAHRAARLPDVAAAGVLA